jgi:hypothetical protein
MPSLNALALFESDQLDSEHSELGHLESAYCRAGGASAAANCEPKLLACKFRATIGWGKLGTRGGQWVRCLFMTSTG